MTRMFLAQIMFLTKIPVPKFIEFNEDDLVKGVIFAPAVGIIIGLLPASAFLAISTAGFSLVAAVTAITLQIMLTGALHLDGLADTADGFLSYRDKTKILEIMKDSRIGTNGTLVLIIVLLLKFSVLLTMRAEHAAFYLLVTPVAGRMTIAWSAGLSSYARKGKGMGKAMVEKTGRREIIISTVITLALISAVFWFKLIILPVILVAAAAVFAFLFSRYSEKKIGGMTGDVIGAVIELTELVLLVLLLVLEAIPALAGILP